MADAILAKCPPGETGGLARIVLPTRDRARVLRRSIDSILAQTWPHWELIVVDDGSKDDTEEVVRSYRDARIIYMRNPGPHGVSRARNAGISRARGDMIGFNDAGDEWLPEKLAVQMSWMDRLPREVGVVYTSMIRVHLDGSESEHPSSVVEADDGGIHRRALALELRIGPPSALIRSAAVRRVGGFDERMSGQEDLDFFIRVAKHYRMHHIGARLVKFYDDSRGLSRDHASLFRSHRRILVKHRGDIGRNRELLSAHFRVMGRLLLLGGDPAAFRRMTCRALAAGRPAPQDALWLALSFAGARGVGAARALRGLARRRL